MRRPSSPALPGLRLALLVAIALLAACDASGSNDAGAAGAAGAAADAAPDAPSDASSDASSGGLDCTSYCTAIQAACTTTHQQYSDMPSCLMSCAAFPVGTAADTSGDTLGCRANHARLAATAVAECSHAGPGGDGVCGTNCDGFCDIVLTYCTAANSAQIYDSRDQCMSDCAAHMTDVALDTGNPGTTDMGDEVACILYHAQMGSVAPEEHCLGDLSLTAGTCR